MSEKASPAVGGQVERRVGRREWRKEYEDAYREANGRESAVVESSAGWYRISTDEGHNTVCQYRRKQIEQMTIRLRERAAAKTANVELTGLRRSYGEGPVERHVRPQSKGD